ncbi:MAG: hypothetical protein FWD55_03310 [Propionibacteriaceae bacterium]|nr:hypothetical protein [Propionibacteriaceae bacterium]
MRWWDGAAWTEQTKTDSDDNEKPQPAPGRWSWLTDKDPTWRTSPQAGLMAGVFFLIAAVLATFQAVYMTALLSPEGTVTPILQAPISLPFDWYLILFPYWLTAQASFSWALIPPIIILIGSTVAAFLFGRHRPHLAILAIATLLTVQNLLLLITVFIDSGYPGVPIFMPAAFEEAGLMHALAAMLILRVVVVVIPLLFAATLVGSDTSRARTSLGFFVVAATYFLGSLLLFLLGSYDIEYLITPGSPELLGSWLAPASTLLCLLAMVLFVIPTFRSYPISRRKKADKQE